MRLRPSTRMTHSRLAWRHRDLMRAEVVIRKVDPWLLHRGVASGFAGSTSKGRASHTFTVPSQLAEAIRRPSGLNATLATQSVCSRGVRVSCPDPASHTFTVLYQPA